MPNVMGIAPAIWGPPTWAFLHLTVLAEKEPLDPQRVTYYKQLYELLTHLLPCTKCRNHLLENLSKLPALTTVTSKRELFDWTTQLHNQVNQINHKPSWDLNTSFQHWKEVSEGKKEMYTTTPTPVNYWKYGAILLAILIIGFVISRYLSKQPHKK